MPLSCWFQGSSRIKDKCAMHFYFPLSRYCTFQNSWTWEIPKGEIHVELVDLASLWTCFAPAEGAEIFGHPKLSIFLLKFIFAFQSHRSPSQLEWTCTYNFDVFFSRRRCPKSGAPGRALKTRVPSWRFLSVP